MTVFRRVQNDEHHYDVVVIGSGFGGSVSALRLTEKGYRVGVLEAGRRFADDELPKTSWDVRRFLWAPRLGCKGIQRIHPLRDVIVLAGAGVGGGSLVYANTLYEPKSDAFYLDAQWAGITDWRAELAPFYDQARRMLGVVVNPTITAADEVHLTVAEEMGVGHTFARTPVGVFFGRNGAKEPGVEVDDPFFGGVGPRRVGCREDGECMTGCRHNAKNTLVKNYLYLAEKAGAAVHPETTAMRVRPLREGGYAVETIRSGAWWTRRGHRTFTAKQVIFAAGTLGTQRLLHRMKSEGTLPRISDRLGVLTRTNSEALGGAEVKLRHRKNYDFTRGVAITSSFHPDEFTHVEPVRYGKGSNVMALLATVMTDGGGRIPRWLKWLGQVVRHPGEFLSHFAGIAHWSERTTIALVMQTHDNSLTLYPSRGLLGRFKLRSKQGHGLANPTWIPAANEACRRIAKHVNGFPINSTGEIFDIPMTAHFLGGCPIGTSPDTGVIDAYHRLYGHPGLHVFDGAAVSANLGVNPSLTITAQAERATAMWPNKATPTHGRRLTTTTSGSSRSLHTPRSSRHGHPRRCDSPSSSVRRAATHKPTTCVRPPQQQRVIHRSLTRHERPSTASEALREAEASLVEALRNLEASFEHKLEEVVNALLEEIRRIRELLSKFEVSEDAVMAFVQTVSELLGDKPLTVKDAQRAGILAAAGTSWENELGPLASSADVRQLLGDISRQRVDELLRARRLIGLRDHAGRRQFPLFQFADGQPVDPLIAAYWTVADGAANEWTAASWCVAPDPALQGASPAQWARARRDPDRLLAVARQDAARLAR